MSTSETTSAVPFVDLSIMHGEIQSEIDAAIAGTIERGDFILGAEVERFEADFAGYCGVRHAIGVGSGTAALQIATLALGVEPGAEVIVPAHTYIASALGPLHAGAVPVFCEVDEATGLIDPGAVAATITERTAAIVAVHLYGQACDPAPLRALADRHGIALIEDAAQAHGASFGDARAGSIGDAACFSFYPSKNLGAFGDGGMVCTDDDAVADLGEDLVDNDVSDRDQFEARLAEADAGIEAAARGMASGELASCPATCAYRGGCAHPSICRLEA